MTPLTALAGPKRAIERELAHIDDVLVQLPTAERFSALSIAVSNLSYLLAYLDSNAVFINTQPLTNRIRNALDADAFQLRCADWLNAAPTGAVDSVVAGRWLDWIEERQNPSARALHAIIDNAMAALDAAVQDRDAKLLALLHRLGAQTGDLRANTAFAALISRVADPAVRMRLSRARTMVVAEAEIELKDRLDAVVAARFTVGTPLAHTLAGGSLTQPALDSFLDGALRSAGSMSKALIDHVAPNGKDETKLASAFQRYLSQNYGTAARLSLPLALVLDVLGEIAERALDLRVLRRHGVMSFIEIWQAKRLLGIIELDGLDATQAATHRRIEGVPTARVLCRLNGSGMLTLSFDSMRMVFHEFGHALAHILTQDRQPSLSGLDRAAIERLELLSTWFEHWVYHPDLSKRLSLAEEERGALASARVAKLLEAQRSSAGRAVCARLDFDLHRAAGLAAQTAWDATMLRLPGPAPDAGDVWTDFTHPVMRYHPGSAFVFPLAQCFAAERLVELIDLPLEALAPDNAQLGPAVRNEMLLEPPAVGALEQFFEKIFKHA